MFRTVAAVSVVGASASVHPDRLAMVQEIQNTPNVLWKAGVNHRFASDAPGVGMKPLLGVKGNATEALFDSMRRGTVIPFPVDHSMEVPEEFDSATNWPKCAKMINDIRDQSACGCCWAFSAAETASDRMCIATDGALTVPLSTEDVCFCSNRDGCNGGFENEGLEWVQRHGAVSGGQYQGSGPFGKGFCQDFSLPHCHHHGPQGDDPYPAEGTDGCPMADSPKCPTSCDSGASDEHSDFAADKYSFDGKIHAAGGIFSGEKGVQQLIMAGGPVATDFTVYADFENYVSGIYHHVSGGAEGGHAVKIVGWGVEDGTKYWKIANSWNPHWGENGYFRIKFGEGNVARQAYGSAHDAKWSRKGDGAVTV